MADLSIPLPILPARVSPGRAYFQCRNRRQQSRDDGKGKGKQRASSSPNGDIPSGLAYDAIYAGLKDNPLFKKLQQDGARTDILEAGSNTPIIQTLLYCDSSPVRERGTYEPPLVEELAWCGSTLIWSKGTSIYRKYSFSEDLDEQQTIQQALFAYFEVPAKPKAQQEASDTSVTSSSPSSPPALTHASLSPSSSSSNEDLYGPFHSSTPLPPWSDDNATASATQEAASTLTSVCKVRVLVVLQAHALRLYYPNGQNHVVPLAFHVEKVFALERGVILQRKEMAKTPLPDWWPSTSSSNTFNDSISEPVFYTLLEPSEEARPVSKVPALFNIPTACPADPFLARQQTKFPSSAHPTIYSEKEERIVYASDRKDTSQAVIVSLNRRTAKLSIWSYASVVPKPLDEVQAFRLKVKEEELEELNPIDELLGNISKAGTSFAAPLLTLGKRRRSNDGLDNAAPSSEPDFPASTADSEASQRPSGSTAISRRISALLDRRKSHHNPDSTVADLLGSLAPAGMQGATHATGSNQEKMHRRTALLKTVTSAGMDRRSSTTRNELSVSLDRMAIGASLMPAHSQTSQPSSSQQSAVPTTVDPGELASHDKQERFEALVGHGELERETSVTAMPHYDDHSSSDIFISRLYSVELSGVSSSSDIEVTVFGATDSESTLAVLVPSQQSLALFRITVVMIQEDTKLACHPVRQLDAISMTSVMSTRTASYDLMVLDTSRKLSLLTPSGQSFRLHIDNAKPPYELCNATADSVEVHFEGNQQACNVSTLLLTKIPVIDNILSLLSSVLGGEAPHILTLFWRHYAEAIENSPTQAILSLQFALLGENSSNDASGNAQSDWDWLSSQTDSTLAVDEGSENQAIPPVQCRALCLYALHLMSEQRKLFVATQEEVRSIANLVHSLACSLRAWDYADVAIRDGARSNVTSGSNGSNGATDSSKLLPLPFDIHTNLLQRMKSEKAPRDPFLHLHALVAAIDPDSSNSVMEKHFKALQSVIPIYDLFRADLQPSRGATNHLEQLVLTCANECMTYDDLSSLTAAVSLPLREAIRHCQSHTPTGWPKRAYALMDRADQMATTKGPAVGRRREPISMKKRSQYTHDAICDTSKHIKPISYTQHLPKRKVKTKATRFSLDHRLDDVQRMLNYTSSLIVKLPKSVQPTEAELPAAQSEHVLALAQRTLALPVGHGIFFFRATARPRSVGISIPKMELSARVLPGTSFATPDVEALAPEEKTWPYFHSGVATALHIAWSNDDFDASEYTFHRPAELNGRHGGFLLGLGLAGQIRSIGTYQAFKYLDPKHEYTSVGLLLGLGAAYLGTADVKVSSTLSVHTAALHPPTAVPLNVVLSIQAAGLFGIGLLHVASANRRIADNILRDLSQTHITGTEHPDGCLEAYAISSGFAYGLVMLGRGNEYGGPSDANILGTFKYLLEGGRGTHLPGAKKNVEGTLNAAVTSPAATIALGLTFLRTSRQDAANLLELPQSLDRLDHIRNDLILLRTACRHLIMWDKLSCNKACIEGLVPPFLTANMRRNKAAGNAVPSDQEVAYWHVVAGGCLAIGLKFAGSAKVEAHSVLVEYLDILVRKVSSVTVTASLRSKLAYRSLQNCVNTICLALTSVMAGTGELNVLRRLRAMHGNVRKTVSYGTHMAIHMALGLLFLGKGRFTLGTSKVATAALLCAFYPVFPQTPSCNRFHLQALRHMWVLAVEPRCLIARDVESGMSVYLRLKFKLSEDAEGTEKPVVTAKYLTAPTLTPSLASIVSIQTDSPRYWPVTLDFQNVKGHLQFFIKTQTIFVKRKAGHLSYAQDPRGIQSLYTQPESEGATNVFDNGEIAKALVSKKAHLVNLIASFQSFSPIARTDLKSFCLAETDDLVVTQLSAAFMTTIVMESLVQDKPEANAVYRALSQAFECDAGLPVRNAQALVFVSKFYDDDIYGQLFKTRRQCLISRDYIEQAYLRVESVIDRLAADKDVLSALPALFADKDVERSTPMKVTLHKLLVPFLQIPPRSVLNHFHSKISTMRNIGGSPMPVLQTVLPVFLARILQNLSTERMNSKRSGLKFAKLLAVALLQEDLGQSDVDHSRAM